MTFLIIKIFIYLLLAGGIGFGAGWLFRNLQAQKDIEQSQRAATDAKAKLPQLESLLRGRDEQVQRMRDETVELKTDLKDRTQELKQTRLDLREQEIEVTRLKASAEAGNKTDAGTEFLVTDSETPSGTEILADLDEPDAGDADNIIAELSQEIVQLKDTLQRNEASLQAARNQDQSADNAAAEAELEALKLQLKRVEQELEVAQADLAREQENSAELERERELQNKSLQVLHQQLEMERSRRAANG